MHLATVSFAETTIDIAADFFHDPNRPLGPIERVDQIVSWCHEAFASRDWDYHAPPLGENAVVARFYFAKPADAAAFIERWQC